MKTSSIVNRGMMLGTVVVVGVFAAGLFGQDAKPGGTEGKSAAAPAHRVAAIYFHRTERCPTCRKISAYIEEAIQAGFAQEVKDGRVSVSMIDFQDAKNKAYTAGYKITGPTLVLADVRDGKVTVWKPAPKVWTLVRDKDDFFKYVQDEVRGYLEKK